LSGSELGVKLEGCQAKNKVESFIGNNKLGRETAAEQKRLQPLLQKVYGGGAEVTLSGRLPDA